MVNASAIFFPLIARDSQSAQTSASQITNPLCERTQNKNVLSLIKCFTFTNKKVTNSQQGSIALFTGPFACIELANMNETYNNLVGRRVSKSFAEFIFRIPSNFSFRCMENIFLTRWRLKAIVLVSRIVYHMTGDRDRLRFHGNGVFTIVWRISNNFMSLSLWYEPVMTQPHLWRHL